MEQFKEAKVIILPTKEPSRLIGGRLGLDLLSKENIDNNNWNLNKVLYIISPKVVTKGKQGKYYLLFDSLGNIMVDNHGVPFDYNKGHVTNNGLREILAAYPPIKQIVVDKEGNNTTNFSYLSPTIDDSFLEDYCENPITDVLVEYENLVEDKYGTQHLQSINDSKQYLKTCKLISSNIKINPKDNTITIKKLKDSWNRDEVINIIKSALQSDNIHIYRFPDGTIDEVDKDDFDSWIKNNL